MFAKSAFNRPSVYPRLLVPLAGACVLSMLAAPRPCAAQVGKHVWMVQNPRAAEPATSAHLLTHASGGKARWATAGLIQDAHGKTIMSKNLRAGILGGTDSLGIGVTPKTAERDIIANETVKLLFVTNGGAWGPEHLYFDYKKDIKNLSQASEIRTLAEFRPAGEGWEWVVTNPGADTIRLTHVAVYDNQSSKNLLLGEPIVPEGQPLASYASYDLTMANPLVIPLTAGSAARTAIARFDAIPLSGPGAEFSSASAQLVPEPASVLLLLFGAFAAVTGRAHS